MLAVLTVTVGVVASSAGPAAAAQYQPDAMVKFGNGPYVTNGYYTTNPIDQQNEGGVGAGGGLMLYKIKVQNDGTKRDRLIVKSTNHPAYNEKYLKGTKNVTAEVWSAEGFKTRKLETNEFVVLRLRVKIPQDAPLGPGGISVKAESKNAPDVDEDAIRARIEIVDV